MDLKKILRPTKGKLMLSVIITIIFLLPILPIQTRRRNPNEMYEYMSVLNLLNNFYYNIFIAILLILVFSYLFSSVAINKLAKNKLKNS